MKFGCAGFHRLFWKIELQKLFIVPTYRRIGCILPTTARRLGLKLKWIGIDLAAEQRILDSHNLPGVPNQSIKPIQHQHRRIATISFVFVV